MNRTIPPPSREISQFNFIKAESTRLNNGIVLHVINAGQHDILQLEIIMRSGKWYEKINGASFFTSKMLAEGTAHRSSDDISAFFESFGVRFKISPGIDLVSITAIFLNKHFDVILPVITECLFEPAFPETELRLLKDLEIGELKVNNEKGSYLAGKEFRRLLFGQEHPYGQNLEIENINENINPQLLKEFHSQQLFNGMEIILTGKIIPEYIRKLEIEFGSRPIGLEINNGFNLKINSPVDKKLSINKPGSVQSSIRYGKKIINKKESDYHGLIVLNELFGGFFGSRLMKNIREEKGYTYGIYSSVISYLNESYFVIGADIIKEFTGKAIEEINKEINRLRTVPVSEDELEIVTNYMLGSFLSELETSFALSEKFKAVYYYGLGYDFYENFIDTVKRISPAELKNLAEKYFDIENFSLVIVGDEK